MLLSIAILLVGAAETIVAWRWLRADARARQTHYAPWATLSLLLPALAVGLYLPLRPRGRLCTCPHCQAPTLASPPLCAHCQRPLIGPGTQELVLLSWRLPARAGIPLAGIAAIAVGILTAGLWLDERPLAIPVPMLLTFVWMGFALSLGAISWVLVKTQCGASPRMTSRSAPC